MISLISTLVLTSAPQRNTSESGRRGLGEHSTTSRTSWASVEPILLYGPEAWTLTMEQEAHLDGSVIHTHALDGTELGGTR